MSLTGFRDLVREVVEDLDDPDFLRVQFNILGNGSPVDALGLGLAENGLDPRVGILNERTSVAVEVDALLRVEKHCLARVNLDY